MPHQKVSTCLEKQYRTIEKRGLGEVESVNIPCTAWGAELPAVMLRELSGEQRAGPENAYKSVQPSAGR